MTPRNPAPSPQGPHRGPARLLVVLVVLAAHAGLIAWLARSGREPSAPRAPSAAPRAIETRVLAGVPPTVPVPAPAAVPAAPMPIPTPTPTPPTGARVAPAMPPAETPAAEPVLVAEPPAVLVPAPAGSAEVELLPVAAAGAAASEPAALQPGTAATQAPDASVVPLYPTRLPPAFTLAYAFRRGPLGGSGELRWRPGPDYLLQLEGRAPILGTVIAQTSQGAVDAHGLAPQRFTDRRLRRSEQAVNFQRDAGLISFSGPSTTHPLVPGAQDRLSWMLQLAAIGEAAPGRVRSGRVELFVVGARGDADVWSFRSAGQETLTVGGQPLQTVQLLREPRRPHDTRVEVWLAPDAHHLPVRARLTDSSGEAFELMLEALPAQLRK
ncbi:DUF3108 domain-containing protein [Caldimonas tepidiphila]|uniref:DUF3108 domain-containing protein n=1 Tax=Caldimonas tepidiphila TaxID=2315841 RepID=UPI001300A726|nr:DUF3108 domain-containing protein [Caldimonas tepidiphila]